MFTFNVVKEQHGWTVRMGERMCTPYRSKDLAVREANCLADELRQHGECVEVIVEGAHPGEPPPAYWGNQHSSPAGDALRLRAGER